MRLICLRMALGQGLVTLAESRRLVAGAKESARSSPGGRAFFIAALFIASGQFRHLAVEVHKERPLLCQDGRSLKAGARRPAVSTLGRGWGGCSFPELSASLQKEMAL